MDKAERLRRRRQQRYENSPKGRATREMYAGTERRQVTRRDYDTTTGKVNKAMLRRLSYLDRQIIALDGEGVTVDGVHRYVMLQASTGERLFNPAGLATSVVFRWLKQLANDYDGALFVSFGFGYDANNIVKDLPDDNLVGLRRDEYTRAGAWRVWWRPGKYFGVGDDERNITVWDLRSFHRGTFIQAVEDVLGSVPQIIVDGKADRGRFTLEDVDTITAYNTAELDLMVKLAEHIRISLDGVGIRLPRFDGSGSIAGVLMRTHSVKDELPELDEDIKRVGAFGFIGGRVECVKYGTSNRPTYQYDVNGAYPWALMQLPSFRGTWVRHKGDPGNLPYTLYDVKWWGWVDPLVPAPLPYRTNSGAIVYPVQGRALVWQPEVALLRDECASLLQWYVNEAWQFIPDDPETRPFAFMQHVYEQRQAMKLADNGVASILKLGMNASWGKLAQRSGWKPGRIPTYHHLPAAGLTTSIVRAHVYRAMTARPDDVIAVETDAVITRRKIVSPLVKVGTGLGEWKETRMRHLTYAGSGLAFGVTATGELIERTAGVPSGRLTEDMVLNAIALGHNTVPVNREHFIGVAQCDLSGDWSRFNQWSMFEDAVSIRPTGKRIPLPGKFLELSGHWNPTVCPVLPDAMSHPYEVPWDMSGDDLRIWLQNEYAGSIANEL